MSKPEITNIKNFTQELDALLDKYNYSGIAYRMHMHVKGSSIVIDQGEFKLNAGSLLVNKCDSPDRVITSEDK